jgi:hypothetical protein
MTRGLAVAAFWAGVVAAAEIRVFYEGRGNWSSWINGFFAFERHGSWSSWINGFFAFRRHDKGRSENMGRGGKETEG